MSDENENVNRQNWENFASLYDQFMGETGDEFHQLIIDPSIMNFIIEVKGLYVLDIGCGNGYFSNYLAGLGAAMVAGVDRSKALINLAKGRFFKPNLKFQVCDLTNKLPYLDKSFDLVVANMVLQYLPSLEMLAKVLFRIVRDKGKFIIAIDHPCHALIHRALRLNGIGTEKFLEDVPYFDTSFCLKKSLWDKALLGYYPRPIRSYLSPFLSNGFCITGFEEVGREAKVGDAMDKIPRVITIEFMKKEMQIF
jgi:SAM-dependent methyltransferase